jgi:hypothetical protein
VKQEPWDGCAGNLSPELSFRDEGKLCRACLKRTRADICARGRVVAPTLEATMLRLTRLA